MLRILLIAVFILCAEGFSSAQVKEPGGFFAQRLTVAAGVASSLPEDNIAASAGLLFAPRVFITTAFTDFSVSFDPSPQFLYSFSDSQAVSEKLFFQIPVMLHVNLGHLASKDFHSAYGVFVGGGWNFQFGHGESTNGFAIDAGIRFWMFGQSFSLSYQRLLSHEKIFSSDNFFSLQINLGKYLEQVKANNKVSNFVKPYRKKK
jgi:hypothetical protein